MIFILTFLGIYTCAYPLNKPQTDLEKDGFKGNVRSVKTNNYYVTTKFGEIKKGNLKNFEIRVYDKKGSLIEYQSDDGGKIRKVILKYDKDGNLIDKSNFNSDGTIYDKTIYKYDDKGNLIEESRYDFDGNLKKKAIFKYGNKEYKPYFNRSNSWTKSFFDFDVDKKGNLTDFYSYDSNGKLNEKGVCKHDNEGNLLELLGYDDENTLSLNIIYKYDIQKNFVEYYVKIEEGEVSGKKETFQYDKTGNLIEDIRYNSDNGMNSKYTYQYDNKGNLIEEFASIMNKRTTYKYNVKTQLIEQCYYNNNKLKSKIIFEYDVKGNLIEINEYDSDKQLVGKQTFSCDERGNWIKSAISGYKGVIETIQDVIERKIEYY